MFQLQTQYPIAQDSNDHIYPRATTRDNSINLDFNRKLYALFPGRKISVMDLGCAGGGMVKTILDQGHIAVGLEGSDFSLINQRAEWATIPQSLFTCDVTKPFILSRSEYKPDKPYKFDIVTAWEFVEHICEPDLPGLIFNIRKHLKSGGLLIGSTNDRPSIFAGIEHHRTRKPISWWIEIFRKIGFVNRPDLKNYFGTDWVRVVQDNFVFQKRSISEA